MSDKEIYSNKISKGSRTYFFDIKKSENGDFFSKNFRKQENFNGI